MWRIIVLISLRYNKLASQRSQVMISRPLVAAPLVGWILGNLSAGLASGLLFEMLWLRRPPVGGYMPPDGTLASIATAAVAAMVQARTGAPLTAAVFFSFLFMLPVAHLGKKLDGFLRVWLGALARRAEEAQRRGPEGGIYVYGLIALALGFSCAFAALFSVIILGTAIVQELALLIPPLYIKACGYAFYVIPIVGVADMMAGPQDTGQVLLFVVGFAVFLGASLFLG
ncbi:MAG: PTS sugar transporter subunit IIC [Desulfomonilaceae bacterium]